LKSILLALTVSCFLCMCGLGSAQEATLPAAQSFQITGTIRAGKTPLPGVTITAANTLTGKKLSVVTAANGAYDFSGLPRGRYVVRVEFMGFAPQTQEVVLNPENPSGKFDAELILASRQQQQSAGAASALAASRGFQNLTADRSLSSTGGESDTSPGNGQSSVGARELSSLPLSGAGAEAPTESVSINGTQGRTQDFGSGSEEELRQRIEEFRDRAQREGGFRGGLGEGPGGGGPTGGGVFVMRGSGKFNINQPHGFLYVSDNDAALDARPYSLTGSELPKASYNLSHFGANVGGPLNIPKIFNGGDKWFFFGGWNGTRGSTPYDASSTVPTLAERSGNFSASTYKNKRPVQIFDPHTGQQFQYNGQPNVIDPALISPQAKALLPYIPLPNLNTSAQNFHYVTAGSNNSDAVSFRLVHNFGSNTGPGGGPFGGGGPIEFNRGRRRAHNNINFGLNWTRSSSDIVNHFPSLAGGSGMQGLNASAGWNYGKGRATNLFRLNYNHRHLSTTNLYSTVLDVAGNAGILGVSPNPFDWGIPGISFTTSSFGGLSDPEPRRSLDQTYSVSDMVSWNRGKHNWRFGGDYRRILQSFRASKNAEGSFVFTGFATSLSASGGQAPNTGLDFADFLLGLPQQTSLQSGTNSYDFRANAFDLFVQDDWRIRANLTINFGLRYEYNGPYTEAHDRIVNLAVGPGFTSAVPVVPEGAMLPSSSGMVVRSSTPSLINGDRNNYAPRIGIAWRPVKETVIRAGYGINYNLAQYATIVQNFAFQPPFAQTYTNCSPAPGCRVPVDITLQNGFPSLATPTVTNNFAVDPNYQLPSVQVWYLEAQRTLRHGVVVNLGYNGAKGTHLDVQRAPILRNSQVQPFIYDSSAADSILHAASIRFRKRMAHGMGLGASYTYSKSLDDASSVGGGGAIVSQNALDIAADRGRSSFDQRHKFTGNWVYDLPFGEGHALAQHGAWLHVLSGWQWNGDFTIVSGLPFTPRVPGNALDIGRGVNASLRANYVPGQPISLDSPSTTEWFNTPAFCPNTVCMNPNGGPFGDAGRNIIEGPGQVSVNISLNKTFPMKESRALEFRVQANNVFNTAHFTVINTYVSNNNLLYGHVTAVGDMRRLTLLARFRF